MAGETGGFNLGNAYGSVIIDVSGVGSAMQQAQSAISSGLSGIGQKIGSSLEGVGSSLESVGNSVAGIGVKLGALVAPVVLFGKKAITQFADFNEAMTNVQAVTGASADEIKNLSDQILDIGKHSRVGPQAIAEAFYDIAGGVTDASVRMPTLIAAVKAAEAGNADLGTTTKALIAIMNGYGFSADKAGFATDVLTQVVGKGVGSMNDFATALPNIAGLANTLGISFEDLGAQMAYITTKGVPADEAATQLSGMMVALINPTKEMSDALHKIGFESGKAAIAQLGLAGTFRKFAEAGIDVTQLGGRIEAMRGAVTLTGADAKAFLDNFSNGLQGLTEATQKIQNASPAAQLDFFNSTMSTLSITIGQSLAPALTNLLGKMLPIIDSVTAWVKANPELVAQIGMVVGALAVIAPALIAVGASISGLGTIIKGLGTAITFITSPIGLFIAAGAAIVYIFRDQIGAFFGNLIADLQQGTNVFQALGGAILDAFGSNPITLWIANALLVIRDFFDYLQKGGNIFKAFSAGIMATFGSNPITQGIVRTLTNIRGGFDTLFGVIKNFGNTVKKFGIGEGIASLINPIWQMLGLVNSEDMAQGAETAANGIVNAFMGVVQFISSKVIPALQLVGNWFLQDALPAVVSFVQTAVIPAIQGFFNFLGGMWGVIGPALLKFADFFLTSVLPAVLNFISGTVIPGIGQLVQILSGIWSSVGAGLIQLADFFLNDALPKVVNFIATTIIPGIGKLFSFLADAWTNTIQPGIGKLADFFLTDVLPKIINFIVTDIIPGIGKLWLFLTNAWASISPELEKLRVWFLDEALPNIRNFIVNDVQPKVETFFGIISGVWDAVKTGLGLFADWWSAPGGGLAGIQTAIETVRRDWIDPLISTLKQAWTNIKPGVEGIANWFKDQFQHLGEWYIQPVLTFIGRIITDVETAIKKLKELLNIKDEADKQQSTSANYQLPANMNQPNVQPHQPGIGEAVNFSIGAFFAAIGGQPGSMLNNLNNNINTINAARVGTGVVPIPAAPRDIGGPGIAGMPYAIGPRQLKNEVYIPGADGQFVPNFVDMLKDIAANLQGGNQGGDTINVMMPAAALASPAAAQANGEIFGRAISDEMARKGIKWTK